MKGFTVKKCEYELLLLFIFSCECKHATFDDVPANDLAPGKLIIGEKREYFDNLDNCVKLPKFEASHQSVHKPPDYIVSLERFHILVFEA
jgi:hypothetical protein